MSDRLAETLRRVLEAWAPTVHVAIPTVVERYDAATQRADLRPVVPAVLPAADDDAEAPSREPLPVLPSVPIVWPRGGGAFAHFPLAKGDGVLVVVCDHDPSSWLRTGEDNADPGSAGAHALVGAVGIPGLAHRGAALSEGTTPRVGLEGGPSVAFPGSTIDAGGTDPVALAPALDAHLTQIAASLQAISTAVTPLLGGTPPAITYSPAQKATLDASNPIPADVLRGS